MNGRSLHGLFLPPFIYIVQQRKSHIAPVRRTKPETKRATQTLTRHKGTARTAAENEKSKL